MTPTVNVNLATCTCPPQMAEDHFPECPAVPVLIPCPIPSTVEFQVVLGECDCGYVVGRLKTNGHHAASCASRPIRVACSISGKTWEESEVREVELYPTHPDQPIMAEAQALLWARERWALAKALVLGTWRSVSLNAWQAGAATAEERARVASLVQQRDDVFAAAYSRAWTAMGKTTPSPERRAAHWVLAHYVDRLIEQVGRLP